MKGLLSICFAVLLCGTAKAQTTVTASSLKFAGSAITTGTVTLTGVDRIGNPIVFVDGNGGQNGPIPVATCQVVNGAISFAIQSNGTVSGTCQVPDSTLTQPTAIIYTARVCDTSTGLVSSGDCYVLQQITGVSGATFALDHFAPSANTTITQAYQFAQGYSTPSSCTSPYIFTNLLTRITYVCINQVYTALGGSTTGTSTVVPSAVSAFTNDAGYATISQVSAGISTSEAYSANASNLSSGSVPLARLPTIAYSSLSGLPTVPTTTSQITNNSGFLTASSQIPSTQITGLGAASTHGSGITINGIACILDSSCTVSGGNSSSVNATAYVDAQVAVASGGCGLVIANTSATTAEANHTALRNCQTAHPTSQIHFSPGTYTYENDSANADTNTSGFYVQPSFSGEFDFEPGAVTSCSNATASNGQCVQVDGSTGVRFRNLTTTYTSISSLPLPRTQGGNDAIEVQNASNITFENTKVLASTAIGFWVSGSSQVNVHQMSISNTTADGFHYQNADGMFDHLTIQNTGDDAVAHTELPSVGTVDLVGVVGTDVHVSTSHSRCIAEVGGQNDIFSNFVCNVTGGPGVGISQDTNIDNGSGTGTKVSSAIPTNDSFDQIIVIGAGATTNVAGSTVATNGFDVGMSTKIFIQNSTSTGATNDGFFVYGSSSDIHLSNDSGYQSGVSNLGTGGTTGFHVRGFFSTLSGGSGFALNSATKLDANGLVSDHDGAYGLYAQQSSGTISNVSITDACVVTCNGALAWSVQQSVLPGITGQGLEIHDDRSPALAYLIAGYQNLSVPVVIGQISHWISDTAHPWANPVPSTSNTTGDLSSAESFTMLNQAQGVH